MVAKDWTGAKFAFFIRYQVYLNLVKEGNQHTEAIKIAADECSCDITCVYRAIYFFAKNSKDSQS
jgi:hypothetical protein